MPTEQTEMRRVLYFPGRAALTASFFRSLAALDDCRLGARSGEPTVVCRETALSFVERRSIESFLAALH
nr:hypothetical protein [Thermoanaerobaculia bacterium]